jgi:hypothetical protein
MADPPPHLQRHADKRQARRLEHRLQRELDDPGRLGQALRILGLLGLFLGMAVLGGWLLLGLVGLYSDSFGPLLRPPPEGSARHR